MTFIDVPRETMERLDDLERMVRNESTVQNLISAAALEGFWSRHVVDSLQLLPLAPSSGHWLDIGTGAGFPGMALAIASPDHHFTLVEPRALRAAFLERLVDHFGLNGRVVVARCKVERVATARFNIVSARAVAALDALFGMAAHLTDARTVWVLPKGRTAREELAAARQTWQGDFRLVPSLTDPDAAILVASGVKRRTKR